MILQRLINGIIRFIIEKSNSDQKIKYLRKQGMIIGKNCYFETMSFSTEPYLIKIGDHVAIAHGTIFITHDGGIWCFLDELPGGDIFGKIEIGNNVHIGMNCTILPNTSIGNNCMIGASSVVRGKFPDNSVIIGNPAKVLTGMNIQKFLYKQNPGLIKTGSLTDLQKKPIVMKHFGLKKI
jgi:acetyltransferase-like isoleucine patch superfamily enzyme